MRRRPTHNGRNRSARVLTRRQQGQTHHFYPVCGGTFDLEKGWDPLVNDVRIKARLVNGVEIDISDWQFEDTTEGRVAFSVESVSDGTSTGLISTNKNVQVNGKNFPTDVAVTYKGSTLEATYQEAR